MANIVPSVNYGQQLSPCFLHTHLPVRYLNRSTRINRRLRKYRADKIQRESSASAFNKKEESGNNSKLIKLAQDKQYELAEIFAEMEKLSKQRKFVESVDTIIKLNVDPTKGDQMIRGTCILPGGTGKEVKVCVFAAQDLHEELLAVGADIIGNDKVLADIASENIEFDKLLCSQEMIQDLKAYARILGPRGLMPNTKSGTLVKGNQIVEQVRQSKAGLVEFRVNSDAFIKNKIGLRTFDE